MSDQVPNAYVDKLLGLNLELVDLGEWQGDSWTSEGKRRTEESFRLSLWLTDEGHLIAAP
jgi:hypothetical protein